MDTPDETYVDAEFSAQIRTLLEERGWTTLPSHRIDVYMRTIVLTAAHLRLDGLMGSKGQPVQPLDRQPPQPLSCLLAKCIAVVACEPGCKPQDGQEGV